MSWYGALGLRARLVAVGQTWEGWQSCTYFEVEKGLFKTRHGDGVGLFLVTVML